jgi:hypothetical protein
VGVLKFIFAFRDKNKFFSKSKNKMRVTLRITYQLERNSHFLVFGSLYSFFFGACEIFHALWLPLKPGYFFAGLFLADGFLAVVFFGAAFVAFLAVVAVRFAFTFVRASD